MSCFKLDFVDNRNAERSKQHSYLMTDLDKMFPRTQLFCVTTILVLEKIEFGKCVPPGVMYPAYKLRYADGAELSWSPLLQSDFLLT